MSRTRSDLKGRLTDGLYGLGWGAVKKLPEPVAAAAAKGKAMAETEAVRKLADLAEELARTKAE